MKKGVHIINCARGGLIQEQDLKDALDSGHVAGAALDVFEVEPATDNILFNHPNVICTPHLGAATNEAQVNVAIQVAEQMVDFLNNGAISNAVNMPSISAQDAPKLKPYIQLSKQLGQLAAQITQDAIQKITVFYEGEVAHLNTKPLTQIIVSEILKPVTDSVNMVNALSIAKGRDIEINAIKSENDSLLKTAIGLEIHTEKSTHSFKGTLFADAHPRIVNVEGVALEAELTPHMIFMRNDDKPGLIGKMGSILGDAAVNISDFRLGRRKGVNGQESQNAVALISLDSAVPEAALKAIEALDQILEVRFLQF